MGVIGDVITGQKPAQADSYPLGTGVGTAAASAAQAGANAVGGLSGNVIAQTALQYVGHAYRFGGAPGPTAANPWDCSSMVNFVCGVKLGLPIPGYAAGRYKGTVHGPPTGSWMIWPGIRHVKRSEIQAGDIVVWTTHMGIVLGPDSMVSALNPKTTTKVTGINPTSPPIFGRYPTPSSHAFE